MRRAHVDPFHGLRIEPTAKGAPAGNRQGGHLTTKFRIYNRKLYVALPWRVDNRLPSLVNGLPGYDAPQAA